MSKKYICYMTCAILILQGCAMTPKSFVKNRAGLDNVDVCRRYEKDYVKLNSLDPSSKDYNYLSVLESEVRNRNLNLSKCETILAENAKENAIIGALVIGAAALIHEASKSGGGYGGTSNYSKTGYAWDAFYDSSYNLVWRCRNKSNGQFAYDYNCASMYKSDNTWPSK